jgi:hypothetical protein
MKTCHAGHTPIVFIADPCPICDAVNRLDKENLKLTVKLEERENENVLLQMQLTQIREAVDDLRKEVVQLTNRMVNNRNEWIGGT